MKKVILLLFIGTAFGLLSQSVTAQQNFVYDGEDFNIWFKTNSTNTQVIEVYFTSEGQWQKFSIEDYENYEDEGSGFAFKVKDGVGRQYWIDYYSAKDYIVVKDEEDDQKWTLYRRKN